MSSLKLFPILFLVLGLLSACASTQEEQKQCSAERTQQGSCDEAPRRPSQVNRNIDRPKG